jgi:hypothetical protein
MGKTILELFQTRNDKTGDVAQKKYDIRDSKERGIQTNSFLINNSAVYAINIGRRTFGVRRSETFLEEDGILGIGGVGIRPLYTLSTPILHGTDVLRLETQRTDQTDAMKNAANGGGGTDGLLGGGIQKLKKATTSGLEKLGVKFPSDLNPTNYVNNLQIITNKSETPVVLSDIRSNGEGNILGKALAQGGTPEQLVKNVAGAAVSDIKKRTRGTIFGDKSTTGFSNPSVEQAKGTTINYGSSNDAEPKGPPIIGQYDDETPKTLFLGNDANGRRYSKTFNLQINDSNDNGSDFTNRAYDENVSGFNGLARKYTAGKNSGTGTSPDDILDREVGVIMQPHLSRRLRGIGGSRAYSKLTNNNRSGETKDISNQSLEVRRGMKSGSDIINQSGVYSSGNTSGGEAVDVGGPKARLGWYYDFVPLKINRLNDNKTVYFRSTISGLSETFSPSWDSAKFIGNPFNYYTYTGIERSVSFNLKVYALNGREMVSMWDKLEFLSSLTYPAGYQSSTAYIIPPFIKFTLGSMYDRKEGFIESLTYTIDDNTPWETGIGILPIEPNSNYDNNFRNVGNTRPINGRPTPENINSLDNYRLPMIVDVQMNVKFVESRNNTKDKLYAFGNPVTNG